MRLKQLSPQAGPRVPQHGALLRLPGQHALQPLPPVEVVREVGGREVPSTLTLP